MMKSIVLAFVVLFLFNAVPASALTIVRQDGQGGAKTTIAAAIAAEPDNGSIQIQQFSGPFTEGTMALSNRSLTCTAPTKATINCTQYDGLTINNGSVSNIIMVGTSDNVAQMGLSAYYNVTINNVVVRGFRYSALNIRNPAGYTITVTNTTCAGPGNFDDGVVAICGTGPVTLDHCTLYGNKVFGGGSYANIYVWTNYDGSQPTYTCSNVTVKDCIIDGCDRSIGAYFTQNFAMVHQYNDLIPNWDFIKGYQDQNISLDPTEKSRVDPVYADAANFNFNLQSSSTLRGAGQNGSNIGFDLPYSIKQDGTGNFTTVGAAIAATEDYSTLQIQQFSGAFNEATMNLSNRILTSSTSSLPTINCTQSTGINVTNGQVQKVNLVGTPGTSQTGINITGAATVTGSQVTGFGHRGLTINVPSNQACTVTNTYVSAPNADDSVVGIDNQGGVTLNHCTLIGSQVFGSFWANISINVNSSTYTASNITVQNCILQGGDRAIAAYYLTNATFALNHSYNDFWPNWQLIKWNGDNGSGTLGTGDVQNVYPLFRAPARNDFRLSPMSYMCGTGSGGSNIGADTVTARNSAGPGYNDTLVAADALGRVLPGYATCGAKKTGRFVGVFFEPWLGPGMSNGPYDQSAILAAQGWNPVWPGNSGDWFFWGKPEMGYYYSNNEYIIRQQVQMFCDAGIDALFVDFTNGYDYKSTWYTICQVFQTIRNAGGTTPQLVPWVNNSACGTLVYNELFAPGQYSNLWFQWDGKPLMLCEDNPGGFSTTVQNFFTTRRCWAWTRSGRPYYNGWYGSNTSGKNKWPFVDDYPANFGWKTSSSKMEEIPVAVCQDPSERSYPYYKGIGRSYNTTGYNQGPGQPSPGNPGPLATTPNGVYFALNWSRALSISNVETNAMLFITGWNSWITQKFITTDSTHKDLGNTIPTGGTWFSDEYAEEFSGDIEPMEGGHTDNYYYQMIDGIRRWKGVSADPVSNAPITIAVDGSFNDWNSVTPVYRDYVSDAWQRNTYDWNNLAYNNNTGRNDFTVLKVTNDATNIYFYAECLDNISPNTDPNWMWLFINKDMNWTTGWQGYDYLVNYPPTNSTQTSLKQATTTAWSWTTVSSSISYAVNGNKMEICIPRASLGIGAGPVEFSFKWADNVQTPGNVTDFSTQGDSAPNRRFAYHYKSNN